MNEYIIGITAYYHDSSACLFINGKLVFACEEEKFSGIKHDSSFPDKVVDYIFKTYQLTKNDIGCVCYYENPILRLGRWKSFFKSIGTSIKVNQKLSRISNRIHYTPHHISHMMYSYLSSKFEKAVVVSVDGVGEVDTVSIGFGKDDTVTQLASIKYPHSLGLFYSAMTAFLGFKPNEGEYKVMGLASYGNPQKYYDKVKELLTFDMLNCELKCDMKYFNWDSSNTEMFNYKLEEYLELDCRLLIDPITTDYKDLAASVQLVYEEVLFSILRYAKLAYPSYNLCLGGGCAYNGTANGKIISKGLFNHIWIPSAPSDAGSSIGSCLDYLVNIKGTKVRIKPNPFLGPAYTDEDIVATFDRKVVFHKKMRHRTLLKAVARHLADGLVVGWFQGNIEFGARALGNRSILANPTLVGMKDRINSVIKKRESFRPFAPVVCFENQSTYFESKEYIPYMNQVVKVKPKFADKLPAVTHIDGTARVQSVNPYNPIYELLKEFEALSGYPILLNTSFNVKDKTMVLTPHDAMNTFLDTDMDVLVMGDYIIYKNKK